MAGLVGLQASSAASPALHSASHLLRPQRPLNGCALKNRAVGCRGAVSPRAQYREGNLSAGIRFRRLAVSPFQVVKAAGSSSDSAENSSSPSGGGDKRTADESSGGASIVWQSGSEAPQEGIVVSSTSGSALQSLSQDVAMGLVLREAAGTSWTTGSGLEGPTGEAESEPTEELKFPNLSKSPRRKMRVAFTCNVCGERTIRAINPLAYTDGTVFVQCKGCDVFHKLVDNLKLFHEMRGKIYRGHDVPWYASEQPYNFIDGEYPIL